MNAAEAKIKRDLKSMSPATLKAVMNKCRATIQYPGQTKAFAEAVTQTQGRDMTVEAARKAAEQLLGFAQAELNRRV